MRGWFWKLVEARPYLRGYLLMCQALASVLADSGDEVVQAFSIWGNQSGMRTAAVLVSCFRWVTDREVGSAPFSAVDGMSGQKYRAMINRFAFLFGETRYLEIGSWKGSTLCSILSENSIDAVVIDNWSEFGGPVNEFRSNLAHFVGESRVQVIESDWRDVDFACLGDFDVFLSDGPHDEAQQRDATAAGLVALKSTGLLVVDDWNWDYVRKATAEALQIAGRKLLFTIEVRTTLNNKHPEISRGASDWHNGYLFAVVN